MKIIISIIFSATAILLFFTWTNPFLDDIKILNAQSEIFNGALERSKELQSLRNELMSKYNSVATEDIKRIDKLIPSQNDSIRIIIDVEGIVKRHGLLVKKIDIGEFSATDEKVFGSKPDFFQTALIEISAVGSYDSMLSFLADLEKSLRLIDIDKLDFTSSGEDVFEFNINAMTFWKK